ncbi:hypothetical protein KFL_001880200 [Klebsormidium nitens]|uniref:DNA-directed primase/polymerase protein n=1 Tax=Klebsormidium nitens TaxID=105231 RepID=A0A1Y1I6S5_KLENI|nr:hypothetical protein KFL_001880200 [Klebsormidium nitens]|eukprot:GAQ84427.1 hypothetical protein KFL_001880200 [Klebsormidium nitens]
MRRNRDQIISDMPGFELLSEPLVMKYFKTLAELFNFAGSYFDSERLLLLARQDPEFGNYSYYAVTIDAFLKSFQANRLQWQHTYEIFQTGRRCHLFFDLEYRKACNPNLSAHDLVDTVLLITEEICRETYGTGIWRERIVELDASYASKFSRHIIVPVYGRCFANVHEDMKCFVDKIVHRTGASITSRIIINKAFLSYSFKGFKFCQNVNRNHTQNNAIGYRSPFKSLPNSLVEEARAAVCKALGQSSPAKSPAWGELEEVDPAFTSAALQVLHALEDRPTKKAKAEQAPETQVDRARANVDSEAAGGGPAEWGADARPLETAPGDADVSEQLLNETGQGNGHAVGGEPSGWGADAREQPTQPLTDAAAEEGGDTQPLEPALDEANASVLG